MKTIILFGLAFVMSLPQTCLAHREDYIDETVVFLTLERGNLEPEYWFDAGRETDLARNFIRHNVSAEYGITEHWMVDGRISYKQFSGSPLDFESGRFETRLRFGDEGTNPVDIAVSTEVNGVRMASGENEYGVEPRLILSRDFAEAWNITTNFPLEIPLQKGNASFTPALGIRYNTSYRFRFGSELKYDTELKGGSVVPQVWFVLSEALTFKVGYSQNIGQNHERFFRAALEAEL
jgi:hypothetical protein